MKPSFSRLLRALSLFLLGGCASNTVVNLSHYDEARPQFARMASEGIVGVIHEATFPVRRVDDAYANRQNTALADGLLWGAYHFADATDPVRQADHFLDTVASRWRESGGTRRSPGVLLVLDFEVNDHYPGGTMRVDQAVAFVERIHERTGKYPGLYTNENRVKRVIDSPTVDPALKRRLARCWLWIANYHHRPAHTAPWSRWSMWQYTGDGTCDLPRSSHPISLGGMKNAERNFFAGSASSLRSFWKEHAWQP